ncbi:MAG: alpha-glucosidase [Myxococcota bacterium]
MAGRWFFWIGLGVLACRSGDDPMAVTTGTFPLGTFSLTINADSTARLAVTEGDNTVWESPAAGSFVGAAEVETEFIEQAASVTIEENQISDCRNFDVTSIDAQHPTVTVAGRVTGGGCDAALTVTFTALDERQVAISAVLDDETSLNRIRLRTASRAEESFYGFGEQYSPLDQKGRRLPIVVQEQGIGRGDPIVTPVVEQIAPGTGGSEFSTNAPMPHYITSDLHSMFLENDEVAIFDMTADEVVETEVLARRLDARVLHGDSALDLIETFTEYSGRMEPLPNWVDQGAIVWHRGGEKQIRGFIDRLAEFDVPVAAMWIEDWVGDRETILGRQLFWNWILAEDIYPTWTDLVADLRKDGIRVLTYVNPFLIDVSTLGNFRRNLFAEAEAAGYLVANEEGETLLIPNSDFSAAIVDLTNPDAREWFKGVMRDEVLSTGTSGWMCDFGEALPFESALFSGDDPVAWHNRYPVEWAKLNREVLEEEGLIGDALFFARAAYTESPGLVPLFWEGDQNVTWDEFDGIKSAVVGLLSGGYSGMSLNHSDIGGFTTLLQGNLVLAARNDELLSRWMEANAFTAVYRTHGGSNAAANSQWHTNDELTELFGRMAKVYRALTPYRRTLFTEASERGWPVVRHLPLHYPDAPELRDVTTEWLLGSEFLVAPVLDPGQLGVNVTFPPDRWVHVWTGDVYGSADAVSTERVDAPIGEPAVFYREGSAAGADFVAALQAEGLQPWAATWLRRRECPR